MSRLLIAVAALSATACVSQTRYNEAVSAARVEEAAHRRTLTRLTAAEETLAELQRDVSQRDRAVHQREQLLAKAELGATQLAKQREAAEQLVEQLQGDLARVGGHLREYAADKERLQRELDAAEQRAKRLAAAELDMRTRALIVRDLALALDEAIRKGSLAVSFAEGRPVVRIPASDVFLGDGNVAPAVQPLLVKAAQVKAASSAQLELGLVGASAEARAHSLARLGAVARELRGAGIPAERVSIVLPEADEAPSGSAGAIVELAFATEPPPGE